MGESVCSSEDIDRPTNLEHRRVGHVEGEAGFGDEVTALRRLLHPLLRQGDVFPAGETILVIPSTLSVPG